MPFGEKNEHGDYPNRPGSLIVTPAAEGRATITRPITDCDWNRELELPFPSIPWALTGLVVWQPRKTV